MRRQENTRSIGRGGWRQLRLRYLLLGVGVVLGAGACSGSSEPSSAPVEEEAPTTTAQPDTVEATVVEDELELSRSDTQEAEAGDPAPEFIDIPYWDVHVLDGSFDLQIDRDSCGVSAAGLEECPWEMNHVIDSTIFGRASVYTQGTMTVEPGGCATADGTTVDHVVYQGVGAITAAWGDEAFTKTTFGECGTQMLPPGTWRVTGGTGRFEEATGLMNSGNVVLGNAANSLYVQSLTTGTISVRADLWKDWLVPE